MVDSKVAHLLEKIKQERDRQRTLPGSEFDARNSVNDWLAIAGHYLTESAKRKSSASYNRGAVSQEEFEDSLIKAAAVILAALEHSEVLKKNQELL